MSLCRAVPQLAILGGSATKKAAMPTHSCSGVCGFTTEVTATADDMQNVTFQVESDCENIQKLADGFPSVDGYSEIGAGFDGVIHHAARETLRGCCSGCVVPCGIFKSM